jgi:hypothetical protein
VALISTVLPLLPITNRTTIRVSPEDAIVGEGWGDPNIGQLCKLSINVLTKTQQFDRFLNRFGRSRVRKATELWFQCLVSRFGSIAQTPTC